MNNTTLPQCPGALLSAPVRWVQACTYSLIILVAIVGNAMVIRVVLTQRGMRTPTNYLIVNIAASDLVMAFLSMLPTLVTMLLNERKWTGGIVGEVLCKIVAFAPSASISCSIFSMTALACERYVAVVFPMKRIASRAKTKKLILTVWIASLLTNAPLLYASRVVYYQGVPYCSEDWAPLFDRVRAPAIFTISSFVLQYALPILVITPLCVVVIVKVWQREIPGHATRKNARLQRRSRKNVLKMLVATVVAFAACWILNHVNYFLQYFRSVSLPCGLPRRVLMAGFLLSHSNTAINCFIYATFSDDYRRGFRKILRPLFRRNSQSLTIDQSQRPITEEGMSTPRASTRGSVRTALQTERAEDLGRGIDTAL